MKSFLFNYSSLRKMYLTINKNEEKKYHDEKKHTVLLSSLNRGFEHIYKKIR